MSSPTIFLSHGSPELPLQSGAAPDFLKQLGTLLGKPKAILAISAHWGTRHPVVSAVEKPQTIYDFSGFPAELYRLRYPAPGAPGLAARVIELLTAAGIEGSVSPDRGLDHGAWTPLMLMYPAADVPVTQLSIQPHLSPAHHLALGRALEPLRHEGVLILASGSATHNLWEFGGYTYDAVAPNWVTQFADWLTDAVTQGKVEELLNYRQLAPHAARNHPTEEHLLPLFVALGAGGTDVRGYPLHSSFTYGVFSMAVYMFAEAQSLTRPEQSLSFLA